MYSKFGVDIPMVPVAQGEWLCSPQCEQVLSSWDPTDFPLEPELAAAKQQLVDYLAGKGRVVKNDLGTACHEVDIFGDTLKVGLQQSDYFSRLLNQYGSYLDDPELGGTARKLFELYDERSRNARNSPFPNGLGVSIAITTSDQKTLVAKRSAKVAVASATYAPTVSGGIRPSRGDCEGTGSIPVKTIVRQTKEELGLDLELGSRDTLIFTCLAQDETKFYKPELVGVVMSQHSADTLQAMAAEASDRWEADHWLVLNCSKDEIVEFVASNQLAPVSQLTLIELAARL